MPEELSPHPPSGPRPAPDTDPKAPRGPGASGATPALVVAAALSLELKPLLKLAAHLSLVPSPRGAWAWAGELAGQPVLIVRTGMGRRAAERARTVLAGRRPAALISAGTCGALMGGLARGDLVLAQEVAGEAGGRYSCDRGLLERAKAAAGRGPEGVRLHRVERLLCSQAVAAEPALKRGLAHRWGAAAVDMESGPLAALAAGLGVPFLALKVVSDEVSGWMLPLDGRGWLAHPLRRTLRLPLYVAGLAGTALRFGQVHRGLEAAAGLILGLARPPRQG